MTLDLTIRQPLDVDPKLGAEMHRLRVNTRMNRFVNVFLETGNVHAAAEKLQVSPSYVMDMLKSPVVRVMIQDELNIAFQAARVTRSRLLLKLWEYLDNPVTDALTACEVVKVMTTLMEVKDVQPSKLQKAVATVVNYELIDNKDAI